MRRMRTGPDDGGPGGTDVPEATTGGTGGTTRGTGEKTGGGVAGRAMNSFGPADEERMRGVRRMKLTATGLLAFVAVVYVLAKWAGEQGAGAWTAYVAAAAEAGMVGAMADWFAVTALF